jgi:hypothetical protein
MDNLNAFVGLRGLQWQRAIKAGLPKWFKDHMALNTQTKFDDFEFKELVVRSVGFRAETHKRQEQQERDRLKKYAEKYEKSKGKDKPKEKSTSDRKPSYEGKKDNKGGNSKIKIKRSRRLNLRLLKVKRTGLLISRRRSIPIRKKPLKAFLSRLGMTGTRYVLVRGAASKAIGGTLAEGRLQSPGYRIGKGNGRLIQSLRRTISLLRKTKTVSGVGVRLPIESGRPGFMRWNLKTRSFKAASVIYYLNCFLIFSLDLKFFGGNYWVNCT